MTAGGNPSVQRNAPDEWIVVKDAHDPLVDRATFERVQQKLSERKLTTSSRRRINDSHYLLSGIVRCAHCGQRMYGARKTRKKEKRTYVYHRYVCSSYHTKWKSCCNHNQIDEAPLTEWLIDRLRTWVLGSATTENELREEIRQQIKARAVKGPADNTAALKKRLAELDREVEAGAKAFLRAPESVADVVAGELAKTRAERDRVAAEIDRAKREKPTDLETEVENAMRKRWAIQEALAKADPDQLRELFRRMVTSIDCYFDEHVGPKRKTTTFKKGVVNLGPELSNEVSRGDWI